MSKRVSFFHSVRSAVRGADESISTLGKLREWLADFIAVTVAPGGLEYWSSYTDHPYEADDRPTAALFTQDAPIKHAYAYAVQGSSEGYIVEMGLSYRTSPAPRLMPLFWIKLLDAEDVAWRVALAISAALNSIVLWDELPQIVDFAKALPHRNGMSQAYYISCDEPLIFRSADASFSVFGERTGKCWFVHEYPPLSKTSPFYVEALRNDWIALATALQISYSDRRCANTAAVCPQETHAFVDQA